MPKFVGFFLLSLSISDALDSFDPVRRTNRKDSPSDAHCVVWGDGPYFGKKFKKEKDAEQEFQRAKNEELVAIHYDNRFREVQRYKSHRVRGVSWHRLADWCKEEHGSDEHSDTAPKLELSLGSSGAVEELIEQSRHSKQSKQASLITVGSSQPRRPAKAKVHTRHAAHVIGEFEKQEPEEIPNTDAAEMPEAADMAVRTSVSMNIAGKVSALEQDVIQLASTASAAFAPIGMKNYINALSLGGKERSTLKRRVTVVENFLVGVADNVKLLELELLGAAGPNLTTTSKEHGLKSQIDSITLNMDSLKHRLPALDISRVLAQLPEFEDRVASYSVKIVDMFKNLGFPDVAAQSFAANRDDTINARVTAIRDAIALAQSNTKSLGFEILEHSWDTPDALSKVKGIKPTIESMATSVDDLQHRVSELESAPLMRNLDKTAKHLKFLQNRAAEISKRVGSEAPSSMLQEATTHETSLKARIPHLEKLAADIDSKFSALENELLGGAKASPAIDDKAESTKSRIDALETKVESLAGRASALEQEV